MHLKISIVTPSLNQGRFIEACIRSVLEQGYPAYEHIIVDGGSRDNTLKILERYPHLVRISEPDRGQADALNKGFKMAGGDLIGWLNADDLYLPGCFHTVSRFMLEHPDVDIVYGDYRFINENGSVLQLRKELGFDLFMLKYLHILYIPTTATFFKRRIFDEGNYLNEDYNYAMDYEFLLRLALKGYTFAHIPAVLADFRWHSQNKSTIAQDEQRAEQERALLELDPFMRRLTTHPGIRKGLRTVFMYLARGKRCWLKATKGYYLTQWRSRAVEL